MTTKNKTLKSIFIVDWRNDSEKSDYITLGICNNTDEAIAIIRHKCSHSGTDDFRVYEIKVGKSAKLAFVDVFRNYASQSALAKI